MSVKGDIIGRVVPPLVVVGGVAAAGYVLYKKGAFNPLIKTVDDVAKIPSKAIEKVNEVTKSAVNKTADLTGSDTFEMKGDGWNGEKVTVINAGSSDQPLVWSEPQALINTGQKIVKATPAYQIGKKLFGWD